MIMMKTINASDVQEREAFFTSLDTRSGETNQRVTETVSEIIRTVKAGGDEAVKNYTLKFDGSLPQYYEVPRDVINDAMTEADPAFVDAMLNAIENVRDFHQRRQCATELSLILRTYLTGTSEDPTLFETHQEFSMRADALMNLPVQEQIPVRNLLQRMVQLKYEPNTTDDASVASELARETKDIIERLEYLSQLKGNEDAPLSRDTSSPKLSFTK